MPDDIDTHTCKEMRDHLAADELHLRYLPKFREYGISYKDGGTSIQLIKYCPWCGGLLPKSLRNEWFEELDRLGLEPEDELPSRLITDEWWRSRAVK